MIGCLRKIVSGGQTGADRGGLDAALSHGLEIGGWAPQGYKAEDGVIPERYRVHMRESVSPNYGLRTRLNAQDSDGTLLLSFASTLTGGSKFTGDQLKHQRKPCKHLVLPRGRGVVPVEVTLALWDWLEEKGIAVLNIAGPRESKERGLQAAVEKTVGDLLRAKASAATTAVLAFCDARDAAHFEVTSRPVAISDDAANVMYEQMITGYRPPGRPDTLTKAEEDHLFRSAFANNGEGIKEAAKTGVLRLVCSKCGERDGCGCAKKLVDEYAAMRAYAASEMAAAKKAIEAEFIPPTPVSAAQLEWVEKMRAMADPAAGYRAAVATAMRDMQAAIDRDNHISDCMLKNGYAGCEVCKPSGTEVHGLADFLPLEGE